jgi:hypothetical protein
MGKINAKEEKYNGKKGARGVRMLLCREFSDKYIDLRLPVYPSQLGGWLAASQTAAGWWRPWGRPPPCPKQGSCLAPGPAQGPLRHLD